VGADLVEDGPLSFHWTATQEQFLVGASAQLQSSADTREAVWVAPSDGTSNMVRLTCKVDDPMGDRVNAPTETGTHHDETLERTVTVQVVGARVVECQRQRDRLLPHARHLHLHFDGGEY